MLSPPQEIATVVRKRVILPPRPRPRPRSGLLSFIVPSHPNKFDVGRHCVLRPLPLLHPTNANGGCPSESCPALRNPDGGGGGGGGAEVWRSVNARRTTNEPDVVMVPQPQSLSSSVAGGGGQGRRRHQSLGGARAATAAAAAVNNGSWAIDL